jgi:phosphatidylserine decarboxylase
MACVVQTIRRLRGDLFAVFVSKGRGSRGCRRPERRMDVVAVASGCDMVMVQCGLVVAFIVGVA